MTALAASALAAAVTAGCSGNDDSNPFDQGGTTSSGASSGTGGASPDDPIKPASGGIRRLMVPQYVGSIRVLFGDIGAAAADPPLDEALKGFDAIGAAELTTAPSSVERYELSARAIASAVVADKPTIDAILPCDPTGPTDTACLGQFVSSLGRVAWRRALTQPEVDRIVAASQTAANAYGTVDAALETIVSALIQSFNFLYIVEIGEPDAKDPTVRRLTPLELATRMSFFLLDATPEATLLDAAEAGQLDDDAGIAAIAKELLARPEAKTTLDTLYAEVFRLRELDIMAKDPTLFPQLTDTLKQAMKEETLQLIRDIVWEKNSDAREMFDADRTFVNAELASLYGISPPSGSGFAEASLPASQERFGLFGHAGLLALLSHTDSTSPTRRGAFIQARLLCNPVPPPPPNVVPVLPPPSGTPKSMKQRLEEHMKEASCASCHTLMDPIGFALEHFDGIGAWRAKDNGFDIDTTGSVKGLGDFAGPGDLSKLVKDDPRSAQCLIKNLFRQSMGHLETDGEAPALLQLDDSFTGGGYRIRDLLVHLVQNPAFRLVGDPK